MTIETALKTERASTAEMKFAGHYLNLAGILLVLVGLSSYLKSTETASGASGIVESALAAGLGIALLLAGENFFRKSMEQFAHPLLTGGFCLLFFAVTSAHFRYGLIGQITLFALLLVLVVGSNASVFRYDSKLLGNVMLVVYFFTPLFMTFSFEYFTGIFCYLLAINLGTTVVAFYKKWDFQLLVAGLGSYALYFSHFRSAHGFQSLLLLVVIYALALVANNAIYFSRREGSSYNLILSFVSPSAFAAFSSMVVLGLSNWIPVSLYATLALLHGLLAKSADRKRETNPLLAALAVTNLALCVLFLSASISFVTYFSETTTYFGLVTLLWFLVALVLLYSGFQLQRYRQLLTRFSYFALAMATIQVFFVLPSMENSVGSRVLAVALNAAYFALLYGRRRNLTSEEAKVQGAVALIGLVEPAKLCVDVIPMELATGALLLLAAFAVWLSGKSEDLRFVRHLTHPAAAAALLFSFPSWALHDLSWLSLPAGIAVLAWAVRAGAVKDPSMGQHWFWVGLLLTRTACLGFQFSAGWGLVLLSGAYLAALLIANSQVVAASSLGALSELCSVVLLLLFLGGNEFLGWGPMLMSALILSASHGLAHKDLVQVSKTNQQLHGLILLRVLALVFGPYPSLGFVVLVMAGLALMKLGLAWPSVGVQALAGLIALFLPSSSLSGVSGLVLAFVAVMGASLTYLSIPSSTDKGRHQQWSAGLGVAIFVRFSLLLPTPSFSTLSWSLLALVFLALSRADEEGRNWRQLGQGLLDYSQLLFFAAFLKSILIDANILGTVGPVHFLGSALVAGTFVMAAHTLIASREVRNVFVISGLLIFCFQTTLLLHQIWGHLLTFQPLLSGFWALTAFFVIACGVGFQVRVYRLLGLTTLVANTLKILFVDIQVLDSYSQTNTYLILGTLLIMTSLLYQKQRARLEGVEESPPSLPSSPSEAFAG